ncbi:MAG: LLM class flavin-dependent oxidoreductase, partial [Candidatus Kariarchaeaceae archaeon]
MTTRKLKYGLQLPHGTKALSTPQSLVELAVAAEEGSWDGFFIWDNMGRAMSDPAVVLAAIATQTEKIKFGPMITSVARRRPWKLAKELITLDLLSNGRVIFGAGLGGSPI